MTKVKVYIETHGCQMNVSDTERAISRLRTFGYEITDSTDQADVVLINTCSVRAKAENKVYNRIGSLRAGQGRRLPLIGIMGCVAQLEGDAIFKEAPQVSFIAGTRATERIPQILKRVREGERRVIDLDERGDNSDWGVAPGGRSSKHVAFVPIIEGCNKFCTYCIVPYSRGREKSRSAYDIVEEMNRLIDSGYKEVHLIGQNVNSYRPRTDKGLEMVRGSTPFSRLLRAVARTAVPRIKFTTSFPRDFHPDIVVAIEEHDNLCNWVHLPVQSGSDRILKLMRRGHTAADYLRRVAAIKESKRRLALTSDIIVGFPGETDQDFEATLTLMRHCQYDGLYIFKYSQRKGTPAANLTNVVDAELISERFFSAEELQQRIQRVIYDDYVGKVVRVLVEGESAKNRTDLSGHTTCHKVINFKGGPELVGQLVSVLVTEAKRNSLYGVHVNSFSCEK